MSNKKPLLEWTSHPLFDFPIKGLLVILFSAFISILVYYNTVIKWEAPLYFYLGMLIYFGSMFPFFIPTRYAFYDDEIIIYFWAVKVVKKYSDFGCYYADKKGVMLSTFKQPRRLDPFRGQSIRFSKTKKEKYLLLKILADKIGNRV